MDRIAPQRLVDVSLMQSDHLSIHNFVLQDVSLQILNKLGIPLQFVKHSRLSFTVVEHLHMMHSLGNFFTSS